MHLSHFWWQKSVSVVYHYFPPEAGVKEQPEDNFTIHEGVSNPELSLSLIWVSIFSC